MSKTTKSATLRDILRAGIAASRKVPVRNISDAAVDAFVQSHAMPNAKAKGALANSTGNAFLRDAVEQMTGMDLSEMVAEWESTGALSVDSYRKLGERGIGRGAVDAFVGGLQASAGDDEAPPGNRLTIEKRAEGEAPAPRGASLKGASVDLPMSTPPTPKANPATVDMTPPKNITAWVAMNPEGNVPIRPDVERTSKGASVNVPIGPAPDESNRAPESFVTVRPSRARRDSMTPFPTTHGDPIRKYSRNARPAGGKAPRRATSRKGA